MTQREHDAAKAKAATQAVPKPAARVPRIDLSALAADAPDPSTPSAIADALMDAPVKYAFDALITEIRRQLGGSTGGGEAPAGGVSQATFDAFKATVVADMNSLRDAIMLTNASLDADAGVATTTFAANGDPPPLTTV